jgi:N-acetylmuramoyl-L-alanine amidase
VRGAAFFVPAILVLLLTPLPQAQGTQPPTSPLTLLSRDGRRVIPTTVSNGRELVALDDVAPILQIAVREDTVGGGLTVTHKGRNILVSTSQPLASVDGRAVSLSAPATRVGNRWSVPTDFFPSALGLIYDGRIELRRVARLLLVGDVRVPRVTARIDSAGSSTRATIEITPTTRASVTTEPGRLVIRLDADALETAFPRDGSGLIEQIRLGEQATTIAVVLAGRAGPARAVPTEVEGLTRIEIEVAPQVLPTETAALPVAPTEAAPPPIDARSPLGTIVIDPGHGGDDIGVRGSKGSAEKTLTLTIAQRLRAMIEMRLGIRVILTRNDDRRVNLDERAAIANNSKADLFLSLHLNSAPVAASAGAEVIHLRLDPEGEDVRRAAEGESVVLPVVGGTTRTVDVIRWDLAQARHAEASAAFAGILEEQLRTRVTMGTLPRRELPLRLLTSVNMPAALVEMAYLSNAAQEQLAQSDAYQVSLAQAMADAVLQFRSYLEERETR